MAYSRYTYFLTAMGRLSESLQKIRRAQQLDPLSPDANASLAYILYLARDYEEAIRYCERTLALEPDFIEALLLLGLSYEQKEMLEEAITQFKRAKELSNDSSEPMELLPGTLLPSRAMKKKPAEFCPTLVHQSVSSILITLH